jgi:hypothetical protein
MDHWERVLKLRAQHGRKWFEEFGGDSYRSE